MTTIHIKLDRFLWYYFSMSEQYRMFISILRFYLKIWSVSLIYHMVFKNVQNFFVIEHILLPCITIIKIKLNKIL